MRINELTVGVQSVDFYLLTDKSKKQTKAGKDYLQVKLWDPTGEIDVKFWDMPENADDLVVGDICKAMFTAGEFLGKIDGKGSKIRPVTDEERFLCSDIIPRSPEEPADMNAEIMKTVSEMKDETFRTLCTVAFTEKKERLMYVPGGLKVHHAVIG